ncbi:MAG: AMP-binding protein, partial [Fimbriimonadaceae bacterium]|nr:AMP-binding protein [Alphaproteobacteria bacterium]
MEEHIFPVTKEWAKRAHVDNVKYHEMYKASVEDPDAFWGEQGKQIDWIKPYTKVQNVTFGYPDVSINWFEDGSLNVCLNCVDRHLETRGDQVAIIWEGDDPSVDKKITYKELHHEVCRFANVLKNMGVKKGDPVTLYMPMIPEAAYAMFACARIGAVHSVVFGGFSPEALAGRINDCDSDIVITADEGVRGGKPTPMKANVDRAIGHAPGVKHVVTVKRTGGEVQWDEARDLWYHDLAAGAL